MTTWFSKLWPNFEVLVRHVVSGLGLVVNLSFISSNSAQKLQIPLSTMAGLGVPVKLLHESLGHIITVEVKTGQLYRGKLAEGERSLTYNIHFIN